jgi:hypothetical protein
MANLYYANQYVSTTLSTAGGIDDSQTTDITLQSVSGIDISKPGIICVSYSDPIDTTNAEWITYTSIDGSNKLVGATRGAEGFAAKSHSFGAVVAFPISESHINNINDALSIDGDATDAVTTTLDEDDMASDSATALATQQSIKAYVDTDGGSLGGWLNANETWTYASATTFTVASDVTDTYQKGDKIKLTQTTVKYFFIHSVSESGGTTTITIVENEDYSLADAAITDNYYSKVENPQGFPDWESTACSVYLTSNQSRSNEEKISLGSELYDIGSNFDATTNYRFTAPISGYYSVKGGVNVIGVASGKRYGFQIKKNGSDAALLMTNYAAGTSPLYALGSKDLYLESGDYIEMFFATDGGTARDVGGSSDAPTFLTIHLIKI